MKNLVLFFCLCFPTSLYAAFQELTLDGIQDSIEVGKLNQNLRTLNQGKLDLRPRTNLIPYTDSYYDLGSTHVQWNRAYIDYIEVSTVCVSSLTAVSGLFGDVHTATVQASSTLYLSNDSRNLAYLKTDTNDYTVLTINTENNKRAVLAFDEDYTQNGSIAFDDPNDRFLFSGGNVLPSVDSSYALGTNELAWSELTVDSGTIKGRAYVGSIYSAEYATEKIAFDASGHVVIVGTITPSSDNAYTLGSAFKRYIDIYAVSGSVNPSMAKHKKYISDLSQKQELKSEKNYTKVPMGIRFKWKTDVVSNWSETEQDKWVYGFLADDLPLEAHPLIKGTTQYDMDNVYLNAVVGLLCAAVNELQNENYELKQQIHTIDERLKLMEEKLNESKR